MSFYFNRLNSQMAVWLLDSGSNQSNAPQ